MLPSLAAYISSLYIDEKSTVEYKAKWLRRLKANITNKIFV